VFWDITSVTQCRWHVCRWLCIDILLIYPMMARGMYGDARPIERRYGIKAGEVLRVGQA
jgi:hypothetical protein